MPTIYRKTAKGLTEIETRAHRLAPRLRSALILVDGKRSDDALRPLIAQQPDATLATLLEQGFIEPLPSPVAVLPAAPAAPARAPGAAPGVGFDQRRRAAVRALNEHLGPSAETLAMRMERARNAAELLPLLVLATQQIAVVRGLGAAEDYAARFSGAGDG